MSGICGVLLSGQDSRVNMSDIAPMVQALNMIEQGQGEIVHFAQLGLGTQRFPGRLTYVAQTTIHGSSFAIAFHGSLYNWRELASQAREANLGSVVLEQYRIEKTNIVQRLRGEFVMAIWDGEEQALHLFTDRFRVHPLFYYQDTNKLLFASHLKAILACPLMTKKMIHPEAIIDIIASSMVPTPKTIFLEVYKLPPGCFLTYRRGEVRVMPYWDINFLHPSTIGEEKLARQLKTQFLEAMSVRFEGEERSERIGTFLSGGVDSSTVTGVLTQLAQRPIKSFSIGFDEQGFNEIGYARIAAKAFGTEHYEYFVTPQDVCKVIPVLIETFDEPFANASAIPTHFCAKLARAHGVEVLYAGDGGDELFAGNERYAVQRVFDYYDKIPPWLRNTLVKPVVFTLADTLRWDPFVRAKKYIQRSSIPYPERLSSYGFFKTVSLKDWVEEDLLNAIGKDYDPYSLVSSYYLQAPAHNALDRQLYLDLKLAITDNDLFKVTRMTEAATVTVRYPFLDHRLAEFAATIPVALKMRGRELRTFFKNAYSDLLPKETRAKQKHGFGLPISVWLRTDKTLNEMMHDLLLSPRSIQRGYFRRKAVEELVEAHKKDDGSFSGTIIWNLMILELWHRTYL